jgi:CHASE2 domain-containing sensor protein
LNSWQHPLVRQWFWLLGLLLLATTLAGVYSVFWRLDLSIYDAALPTAPAPPDVVIVAVDEPSLAALGRWPWRRAVHAALLDRLRELGARAVAMDFLFTESDNEAGAGDQALAAAMTRGPPVVLPLLVEMPTDGATPRERLPIPVLAQAAAGIGHANLEIDADGIVRRLFLREGLGRPDHLYYAASLLQSVPDAAPLHLTGLRHPDLAHAPAVWVRDYQMLIPFLGAPGHFQQLSYIDVLRGTVDAAAVRGKWILVGTTAQGIGDAYPTPRSGYSRTMSGVEVTANVLQALRGGYGISPAAIGWQLGLAPWPIGLAALGLIWLSPRRSLLLTALLWLGTLLGSVLTLRLAGWWWPPSATLATLLLIYPLWSWRRLEATQGFLEQELLRLGRERLPVSVRAPGSTTDAPPLDFMQRRIELLRQATQRVRDIQREREDVIRFLSHDMKSPASSLLGLAQLQRDPQRALPPLELSRRLDQLAQRLLTLVDGFVALARAEAADPRGFEEFDLRDAVQDACDEVWAAAQGRHMTIQAEMPEDALPIHGERALLARALVNLLGNAVKFAPSGTSVALRCQRRDQEALISIEDQGPGVAAENRAALFQRFSRAPPRGMADPGGAGLGLAFVRVVAEKHGGQVKVDTGAAGGAIFRLSLPLPSVTRSAL